MIWRLLRCWLLHDVEIYSLRHKHGPQPKKSRFCRKCGIYVRWKVDA